MTNNLIMVQWSVVNKELQLEIFGKGIPKAFLFFKSVGKVKLLPIGLPAGTVVLFVDAEKFLRSMKMKINQSGVY